MRCGIYVRVSTHALKSEKKFKKIFEIIFNFKYLITFILLIWTSLNLIKEVLGLFFAILNFDTYKK